MDSRNWTDKMTIPIWSEAEKAWLACAIDSEGTILLARDKRHDTIAPRVSVYNTSFEFVQYFARLTGVKVHSRPPRGFGKKEQFEATVCSKLKVRNLLLVVQFYMIVKKAKAEAVLDYIQNNPLSRFANMAHQNTVLQRTEQGHNQAR